MQAAQEREELQAAGDALDAKITQCEAEVRRLTLCASIRASTRAAPWLQQRTQMIVALLGTTAMCTRRGIEHPATICHETVPSVLDSLQHTPCKPESTTMKAGLLAAMHAGWGLDQHAGADAGHQHRI